MVAHADTREQWIKLIDAVVRRLPSEQHVGEDVAGGCTSYLKWLADTVRISLAASVASRVPVDAPYLLPQSCPSGRCRDADDSISPHHPFDVVTLRPRCSQEPMLSSTGVTTTNLSCALPCSTRADQPRCHRVVVFTCGRAVNPRSYRATDSDLSQLAGRQSHDGFDVYGRKPAS